MEGLGVALGLFGAFPVVAAVWYWLQKMQRGRQLLRFSRLTPIDIVLTTSSMSRATHGLPASRPLTGYGQVRGTASCVRALAGLYPKKAIEIHLSGFIRNRLDRDLIVLGGPAKNEAARAFLENFRTDYSLTRFNFDDVTDTIEIEPEGGAPFSVKDFAPSMANGYPLRDFGLIVVAARGGQA